MASQRAAPAMTALQEEFTALTAEQARDYLAGREGQVSRSFVASWIGKRRVLDVGCANGIDAGRYTPTQYVGVDVSLPLLRVARERNPHHNFVAADVTQGLPWAHGAFDVAMAKSVLEHLPGQEHALRALREMLRVASEAVIVVWHTPPQHGAAGRSAQVRGHFGMYCWQNTYDLTAFEREFRITVVADIAPHRIWIVHA